MRRTDLKDAGRYRYLYVVIPLLALSLLSICFLPSSQAQVPPPPISSSGLNTTVTQNGNTYNITGGTRPDNGVNLFHSFGEFGVPTNNIANFLNETPNLATSNILGRVTGPNASNIFGMIQTTGFGNANLFLINPAGFLFGPNATVNVGGMVAFTSADYLKLADNARFNAIPNAAADALLTALPVASFGFLGSNPVAITVQGSQFTVTKGTGISLVGGNISVEGGTPEGGALQPAQLSAPGGQINVASVASPGEVLYPSLQTGSNVNGQSFTNMGAITLSEGSILDVSADAAGTVRIRGGQFVMESSTISADTVNANGAPVAIDINLTGDLSISTAAVPALTAKTTGSGDSGEIRISSQNMDVTATGFGDFTPFSVIDTHTSASGKAGAVSITTTDDLTVTGDPADFVVALDSGTTGPDGGQGGNVTLNAKNLDIQYASINTGDFVANQLGEEATGSGGSLTIAADTVRLTQSFIVTDGFFAGKGGDLTISARDIQINQASALSATGVQQAGAIRITTDQLVVDNSQFEVDNGAGPSGGITIIGKKIEFRNGSTIGTQTFGDEAAGDIKITATEHLTLSDDPDTDGGFSPPTGLYTNSLGNAGPLGNAGAIVVTTPSLEITGGARIDSTTRTSGQGGPITITADTISVSGERPNPIFFNTQFSQGGLASGIYSRTVGSTFCTGPCGSAGSISITTNALDLTQGAQINSGTTSTGRGGDITISAAQSVSLSDGASFTVSSTGPANAGNIVINAGNQFTMTNSSVTTEANLASGGTIKITTNPSGTVQLTNSLISASVLDGSGGGGSVNIDPQYVILLNSQILAQAVQGPGGNITITITNGGLFLPDANSVISASSQFGVSGTVTIQSPNAPASGQIQPLGKTPLIATSLLNQHCASLADGEFSSFTVAGRDSLPTEPGNWLASPLYAAGAGPGIKAEGGKAEGVRPVVRGERLEGETALLSLRQIAPAGFLTQAFAVDWSASCQS
jgi:filamentous hemagglutinin family protein